jgi:hypothetical protein
MKCYGRIMFSFLAIAFLAVQTLADSQRNIPSKQRSRSMPAAAPSGSLHGFFPLEVGNEWVYSDGIHSYQVQVLRKTEETNGRTYFEISDYFRDENVYKIRQGPIGQIYEYNPNGPDFQWYRFGTLSSEWLFSSADDISCVTGSTLNSTEYPHETVNVPAGAFAHINHFGFKSPCYDAGISEEIFAEGIGLIQRIYETIGGPRTYQLVYARLGSRELPAAQYGVRVSMDMPVYFNNRMPPIVNPWPIAQVMLAVQNTTETPMEFVFPTSQRFDFSVRDALGNEVLRWSDGLSFSQVETRETLHKGSWHFPASIHLKTRKGDLLPSGFYTLTGYLSIRDSEFTHQSMSGSISFEVRDIE